MEIGKTLKDKRLEKGFSLEDVEEVTKIRARYLKALENENFNDLPGRVYGKAFLRTYARFLGVDGDLLVSAFDDIYPQERIRQRSVETKAFASNETRGFKKYLVYLTTVVFIAGLMYTFSLYKSNIGPDDFQDANNNGAIEHGVNDSEEDVYEPDEMVPKIENQTLTLNVVSGRCWIEVFSDGDMVYRETAFEGEILEFEAEEGFSFTLGDAGAVEVTINDESLGFLGGWGDVVHYPGKIEGGSD